MDENKPPSKPEPRRKPPPLQETLRAPAESRCLERLKAEHADALDGAPTFYCGVPIVRVKTEKIADVCLIVEVDLIGVRRRRSPRGHPEVALG